MTNKLDSGGQLPSMDLQLGESDTLTLPNDINTPYLVLLFYRGHW